MAANAYILVASPDDSATAMVTLADIGYVRTADGEWSQINNIYDLNGVLSLTDNGGTLITATGSINDAATFPKNTNTITEMRALEGDMQRAFNDRNVELREATVTVTYPAI